MRKFRDDIELRDGCILDVEIIFYGDELRCVYSFKEERLVKLEELMMPTEYLINKYKGK